MPKDHESTALPLDTLAENFLQQTIISARRKIALLRRFPGAYVTFRRAATKGPNADSYIILVKYPGKKPETYTCDRERLDQLASAVSDADVYARLDKLLERSCGEQGDE